MAKLKSKKIIDIWEGQVRVFFNFYQGREKITLGFPKKWSKLNDVYFKINDEEQPRISLYEGRSYLTSGMITMLAPHVKGLTNSYAPKTISYPAKRATGTRRISNQQSETTFGHCTNCGKKLRGDVTKKLCTVCWRKFNR